METLLAPNYRVGIYCRLSKDDDIRSRESSSIGHQREMLVDYCDKRGWSVEEIYVDDGFSGLNQNRPSLKRLLADVEKKKINLVITKDYSRLGRNHLETEHLREDFFPRHDCRYIALNDNIDSLYEDDLAGFKAVINEQYSKDISKKVHSSYQVQAEHGKFTGVVAPFGYKKDPDEKGHLLIDEETADAVRMIFDYARDGRGTAYIKRRLEANKIPCPTWWNRERGYRNIFTKWELKDPENGRYVWDDSVVKDILGNPVYYGAVSGQKKNYKFKLGVLSDKSPEDWIVVEDMHEPIVSKDVFEIVQEKVKSRKSPRRGADNYSIFAGLIKCGECGKGLTIRNTHAAHPIQIYACKTYNQHGKQHCTQHRVEYERLYDICLNEIRELARKTIADEELLTSVAKQHESERKDQTDAIQKKIAKAQDRLAALDRMVARLYEDLVSEKINESTFETMMAKTQSEQDTIKEQLAEYEYCLSGEIEETNDEKLWVELIKQYADITELDAETLNRLIKKIVVHEEIGVDGRRGITVEIHYNFRPTDDYEKHDLSYKYGAGETFSPS
jgi:DNA invertase Pin-like site-specific DNA recombinase